mmetsp:Transcript_4758/g.8145  ORF Transcript_4758/g.8145 Transcript_4758/m.8145 type:complete len:160 (+) Transcript_4758:915-1394(+)
MQGTLILWLAWLMFNGGSTLGILEPLDDQAKQAMINTIISPAMSGICTFYLKKYIVGGELKEMRFDFMGMCNGILAGLVGITGSCNAIKPWSAIIVGFLSFLSYSLGVKLINKLKIDDPIEAFPVHGCCGVLGVILVDVFKIKGGLIYGGQENLRLMGV